jgi:hypothetical protein
MRVVIAHGRPSSRAVALERGVLAELEEEEASGAKQDPQTEEDRKYAVPHLFLI